MPKKTVAEYLYGLIWRWHFYLGLLIIIFGITLPTVGISLLLILLGGLIGGWLLRRLPRQSQAVQWGDPDSIKIRKAESLQDLQVLSRE
ncbi:MAG: hypothetical protein AAF639_16605 [Chloroflexota bacterium]